MMSSSKDASPLFDRIGEQRLRAVVDEFVSRLYSDTMIGFFFDNFDADRLRRHEYQFMARALGAPVRYEGRPVREAHLKHPIMGGQFNRRKTILRETLHDFGVDAAVVTFLLEHTEKLRPLITAQPGSDCISDAMDGPVVHSWRPTRTDEADPEAGTNT